METPTDTLTINVNTPSTNIVLTKTGVATVVAASAAAGAVIGGFSVAYWPLVKAKATSVKTRMLGFVGLGVKKVKNTVQKVHDNIPEVPVIVEEIQVPTEAEVEEEQATAVLSKSR